MNFKLSSTRLLNNLELIEKRFTGRKIDAILRVGDEAEFWYYHEFGTATHQGEGEFEIPPTTLVQEPEGTFNSSGYDILPKDGKGLRLPITGAYPNALLVPQVGGEFTVLHPGVPALGLVRTVLESIHTRATADIANALHDSEYDPRIVQESLLYETMPEVLNLIVENIADKMGKPEDRDTPGKLDGKPPADVFRNAATIDIDAQE